MKSFAFAFCVLACMTAVAQDAVTLRIGDPAPPIKYSKWLKGEPVKSFKGDRLYVLEFWATWCGPCKAAMPHLTKTQKANEGKVTIIGVDVWEKVKEGEKYESALPLVTKFVKGNDANMGYSVVADNNDQYMGNNWLKAAGQNGIPSTFIIKNEKIIWIGHPIKLDSMLEVINNGTYDMQAYKTAFDKRVETSVKESAKIKAALDPVNEAIKAKEYTRAFELMEKVKVEVPIMKISMDNMKFTTLLKHVSEEEAIKFATEWAKDFKSAPQYVLSAVGGQDGLSRSTYLWAAKNFENNYAGPVNPMVSNLVASVYAKAGDYDNAIANQQKAIESAKTALKEGKLIGSIMDYTVTEYEETLAGYKKAQPQPQPFTIEGNIDGKSGSFIYMRYTGENNKSITDSSLIGNGRFSFKGKLSGPSAAYLMMDRKGRSFDKYAQVFLAPGKMKVSVPYNNFSDGITLSGSAVQDEWDRLNRSKAAVRAQMKPLTEAYEKASLAYREALQAKKDEATLEALKAETTKIRESMAPYQRQMSKIDEEFMDKHPGSYVTAYILRFTVSRMSLKEGQDRYNKLSDVVKNSELGKEIKQELDDLRDGSPGATAFQFASQELRGGELKLTDFKGKYVLVDFWASWCVPCRKGNPHLLSLYSKYKNKGFEIIGVSDDDSNPEAWRKAVDQDKIGVWKHVLRGLKRTPDGGFDRSSSISDRYGISSLPTKILIDPNGVIIGRYGGGGEDDAAMDKKLSEIFGG